MSLWFAAVFIWLMATFLAQAIEVGTGFTSTTLAWPLLANDTQAAIATADFPPGGGRIYIGTEAIDYTGTAEACADLPVIANSGCLTGLLRGSEGTTVGNYAAGSVVRGTESNVLNSFTTLRLVQLDVGTNVFTFPVQATRALFALFIEIATADYSYLEGQGQFIAMFLYMMNVGMVVALLRLFSGPLSNILGGVGRLLTGGRL